MSKVKAIICSFILISLCLLVSCFPSKSEKDGNSYLYVESNVDAPASKGISADSFQLELKGVKRIYHNGKINTPLGKAITDANLFYIEYDEEAEGYTNCTLYIPEVILTLYEESTGESSGSDPLLWYLTEYLKEEAEDVRNGWYNALLPLLRSKGFEIPYPEKDKVNDKWKSYDEKKMEDFIPICSDGYGPRVTGKDMNSFFLYQNNKGTTVLHTPCYLGQVYAAGGGKISLCRTANVPAIVDIDQQAFLWYADVYMKKDAKELKKIYKEEKLEAFIDELNASYSYTQIAPETVYMEGKTSVIDNVDYMDDETLVYYHHLATYKPGRLVDEDGMIITDSNRIYAMLHTIEEYDENYILLLIPYDFHLLYGDDRHDSDPNKWECYGEELWNFLSDELDVPQEEIDEMEDEGCIPAKYLKALFAYRLPE